MIIDGHRGVIAFGYRYFAGFSDEHRLKHPFRIVQYYYPVRELQDNVYRRTSIVGKFAKTKDNKSMFEQVVMSVDETDTFMQFLREAADEVARVCEPFMIPEARSYIFDQGVIQYGRVKRGEYARDDDGKLYVAVRETSAANVHTEDFEMLPEDVSHSVHFMFKKSIGTYENSVQLAERSIGKMMEDYVMWKWFMVAYPEAAEEYYALFQQSKSDVIYNMNAARKYTHRARPF